MQIKSRTVDNHAVAEKACWVAVSDIRDIADGSGVSQNYYSRRLRMAHWLVLVCLRKSLTKP
jgi:hypothetical protein